MKTCPHRRLVSRTAQKLSLSIKDGGSTGGKPRLRQKTNRLRQSARRSPLSGRAAGCAMCLPLQDGYTPGPLQDNPYAHPPAAARAEGACESKEENAALEIAADFFLDEGRHGPHGTVAPSELALEDLGDDLVQWRLLGAEMLVAMGPRRAEMRAEVGPSGKRGAEAIMGGPGRGYGQ
jgi:hypothetical protein